MATNLNSPFASMVDSRQPVTKYGRRILRGNNAYAVGIGTRTVKGAETDEVAVKVFVPKKLPEKYLLVSQVLPKTLQLDSGKPIRVDVEEMDKAVSPHPGIGVLSEHLQYITPGNVPHAAESGSGTFSSVGTICLCAKRKTAPSPFLDYFVSCNHVLADFNIAPVGIPVVQPSPMDGGSIPAGIIGYLAGYVPLNYGPFFINRVDAGFGRSAYPQGGTNVVDQVGPVTKLGQVNQLVNFPHVKKIGRTTGATPGKVVAIHAMVRVNYWGVGAIGDNTIFEDQIVTSLMASFGDSGALLLNANHEAVGMLFAGSATHSYFNPLHAVLDAFGLEI